MLGLLDVIWIFDLNTRPQKRKMYVCLSYEMGWFMRINTKDTPRPCVPISKGDNAFLHHDSHIECGILVLDEFEIDEAIRHGGIVGTVHERYKPTILSAQMGALFISKRDKEALRRILA
ncbi:hypothetical protein A6J80_17265 [Paracoccus yeei]|uniref:Uncharacterized protein n=1 Tax=Paracoccus yeei TaxID=147645 RepID=A0A1V0GVF1_9RHOB|nr:hypothetical protein [Paracoccus yeei]ARC37865.1 hypothetical protein A6J80_17265 [Paracoccus yeei]